MRHFTNLVESLNRTLRGNFIVRAESSATALGLANTLGIPLRVYATEEVDIPNVEVKIVNNLREHQMRSVGLLDGFLCTNAETTIIEMLREKADPQTILESLASYYYDENRENWGRLPQLARANGVDEELESYMEDALESVYY